MAALLTVGISAEAQPQTPPSGQPTVTRSRGAASFDRARAAWDKGDYDVAEKQYQEAISAGGLDRSELLDAYIGLGSTCSILGNKSLALTAFQQAALVDPHFLIPPEAGKKAEAIADRARRNEARIGGIKLSARIPHDVSSGESVPIDATLDVAHTVIASKIAVTARDPLSGKSYTSAQNPAATVHFDVPASLTLPGASLLVRVDALDEHQNCLATVEDKSFVRAGEGHAEAAATPGGATGIPWRTVALVAGGVGVAGLIVGGVAGGVAGSKWSASRSECSPSGCPEFGQSVKDHDGALSLANLSTAMFVAGGVVLAGATVLFFATPSRSGATAGTPGAASLRVSPTVAPGGGGVMVGKVF